MILSLRNWNVCTEDRRTSWRIDHFNVDCISAPELLPAGTQNCLGGIDLPACILSTGIRIGNCPVISTRCSLSRCTGYIFTAIRSIWIGKEADTLLKSILAEPARFLVSCCTATLRICGIILTCRNNCLTHAKGCCRPVRYSACSHSLIDLNIYTVW